MKCAIHKILFQIIRIETMLINFIPSKSKSVFVDFGFSYFDIKSNLFNTQRYFIQCEWLLSYAENGKVSNFFFFVLHTAYRTGFYNEYIEYITLRWILMIMTTKENVCSSVKFLSLFSLNQVMVTLKCRTIWILSCNKSKSYFTSCIWHWNEKKETILLQSVLFMWKIVCSTFRL